MKEILNMIHKTIYQFFDACEDDAPMSDKDKLLLEVNKAICNNLKALEQTSALDKARAEIEQLKTYDRYTGESYLACEFRKDVLHIIDKYKAESEDKA